MSAPLFMQRQISVGNGSTANTTRRLPYLLGSLGILAVIFALLESGRGGLPCILATPRHGAVYQQQES